MNKKRVAVFIDNSNVFHNIKEIKKSDPEWTSFYNPFSLAEALSSNENEIVYVGFYCVSPPAYLSNESEESKYKYEKTIKYYSEIEKDKRIKLKYGNLTGPKGDMHEKNVDTQIATDIIAKAALNEYDIAVIVSNDGDYKSAIESAKNQFGRKIEIAFFRGGLSMNLDQICDLKRRLRKSYFKKM